MKPICPLLLARNNLEVMTILQAFLEEKLIFQWRNEQEKMFVSLTCKGVQRAGDLKRGLDAKIGKQVFVAMWFNAETNEAYQHGIKKGIEDAGYKPFRVDQEPHNDKICDLIVAKIKQSRFLVADVTGQSKGVYFEAGLMMGLGREVIFTCRRDEIENLHFDTRQYNHIVWDKPDDLRTQLTFRIQATIQ